jgi:hypothetical protein
LAPKRTLWWSCAAVVTLCLAVGAQTIRSDAYFLGDDFGLVQHLHDLPVTRLLTYFSSDWTEGIYGTTLDELRPFLAFTYWLDAQVYGAVNVAGYHLTNVLLHILNALLVLGIARSIAPREPVFALFAASFFALMPSHSEPIAWISGRVETLASAFYLGAFLCFVRFRLGDRMLWLLGALLLFVCGLFTKQSIVTLPALLIAFDCIRPHTEGRHWSWRRLWPHVIFVAGLGLYLALRHSLFGSALREEQISLQTLSDFLGRQDRYGSALMPTPNAAPKAATLVAEWVTVGTLVLCLAWLIAGYRVNRDAIRRLVFFGPVWYVITIAPMAVTYLSARHLYIPAAGLSIAVASVVLPAAGNQRSRVRAALAVMLLVMYGVASTWDASRWVAAGIASGKFHSAIVRELRSTPRDRVVFIAAPDRHPEGWFWAWATPYVLQPPFTAEDLFTAHPILERAEVYCCSPEQWGTARMATLKRLLVSAEPEPVTYIVYRPDNPGAPMVQTRTIDPHAMQAPIEAALGKPMARVAAAMTPAEAAQVGDELFGELRR